MFSQSCDVDSLTQKHSYIIDHTFIHCNLVVQFDEQPTQLAEWRIKEQVNVNPFPFSSVSKLRKRD